MHAVIFRNLAFIGILALPIGITIFSGLSAFADMSATRSATLSWLLVALALAVVALNLFTSFVRPALHARRNGGSLHA